MSVTAILMLLKLFLLLIITTSPLLLLVTISLQLRPTIFVITFNVIAISSFVIQVSLQILLLLLLQLLPNCEN